MPRIMIKGVIWNRAQDDILKAGVLKYGQNQWERIIHLLPGKTTKQCKDRWEIGLNKCFKKCEWTSKEDDRLQQLVLLMPANWRGIGSIIRRSATDCFNRYYFLMNKPRNPDEDEIVDPKNLVPGRIYRNPGVKRAEDNFKCVLDGGLEVMLSEARARLANQQAKKAKLQAREKRLEIARRFASIKRQREKIKARQIFEEKFGELSKNLQSCGSTDSQSDSWFCYSSTEFVEPSDDLRRIGEKTKRTSEDLEALRFFFGAEDPSTKRRKVLVLEEPRIDYEELQTVVELGRHLEFENHSRTSLCDFSGAKTEKSGFNEAEGFRNSMNNSYVRTAA